VRAGVGNAKVVAGAGSPTISPAIAEPGRRYLSAFILGS
jgi:hypothetical protein